MTTTRTDTDDLVLRRATDQDWPAILAADARAFAFRDPLPDDESADLRGKVDDADVVVVHDHSIDPHPLVAVSMFYRMAMTLPGGALVDLPGLSWVSVAATHRRRGLLRRMITDLFDQWESENQTFAILTASEGTIYERFGFGPACFADVLTIDLSKVAFRTPPTPGRVHYAEPDEIAERVPEIHDRWVATRPGALRRSADWWRPIFADRPSQRNGRSGLHYLLHDDGYAAYRVRSGENGAHAEVDEVVTVTDAAHTDLWQVLTGLDLLRTATASVPVDDPLWAKLTNLRTAPVTDYRDEMWLRILDVPAALGSRRYRAEIDAVIEVTDEFRGRGGVFEFSARSGGAIIAPSTATPTVRLDISVLSSIYLGGLSARTFAAAGRLWTDSPETLDAVDAAFGSPVAPFSGTFF